jgi:hypothetical protein
MGKHDRVRTLRSYFYCYVEASAGYIGEIEGSACLNADSSAYVAAGERANMMREATMKSSPRRAFQRRVLVVYTSTEPPKARAFRGRRTARTVGSVVHQGRVFARRPPDHQIQLKLYHNRAFLHNQPPETQP